MEIKYNCSYVNENDGNINLNLSSCHQYLFECSKDGDLTNFKFDCEIIIDKDKVKTNYKNYPRQSSRSAIEDIIPDFETLQLLFEKCEEIVGWKCFSYEITDTSLKVIFTGDIEEVGKTIKLKVLWYLIRNIIASFEKPSLSRLYVNLFIYNSLILNDKERFSQMVIPWLFMNTIYSGFNRADYFSGISFKYPYNHTNLFYPNEYNEKMYDKKSYVNLFGENFYVLYQKFKLYTDKEFEKLLNSSLYIFDCKEQEPIIKVNKLTKNSKYFINMKTKKENDTFLKNICNLRRFKKWYKKECNDL